ncbi:PDZK1-interacting protein 1 [Enoplosus armatus]|uniref:PDZK1-interacting protein 1 n=1 Tax=Enoplosus armatus TaxID=215367 RepID=UPI00399646CF
MGKLCAVISCLMLTVGAVAAQPAPTRAAERLLPQWLTGIIAVSAFLFLCFVCFLVKKAWCEGPSRRKATVESLRENDFVMTNNDDGTFENNAGTYKNGDGTYETTLDMVRSKEDMNAYDNLVIDSTEDKVTSM